MARTTKQSEKPQERDETLMMVLGAILMPALRKMTSLPWGEAFLVAWTVAFMVGYFIPPRPKMKYARWVIERALLYTCSFWLFQAPELLKHWLTIPFAYGIPLTLFLAGDLLGEAPPVFLK